MESVMASNATASRAKTWKEKLQGQLAPQLAEEIDAFEFRGTAGSFIARKERRAHGHAYWYAYTWGSEGRRKTYFGRPAELKLARLEAMARKLHKGEQGD